MNKRSLDCKEKYEGKEVFCKDGIHKYKILKFNNGSDIEVGFGYNYGLIQHKSVYQINNGLIYPFSSNKGSNIVEAIAFEKPEQKFLGTIFRTNEGYNVKCIEYINNGDLVIQFLDNFGYIRHVTSQNLLKGQVHNPFKPNKFGGYEGTNEDLKTDKYDWLYRIWYNILIRVNDPDYYNKYHNKDGHTTEAYYNTYIDPRFLNYSIFGEWYLNKLSALNPNYAYEVDKDLLYRFYKNNTKGKKCYSPETCELIPHSLNAKLASTTYKNIINENGLICNTSNYIFKRFSELKELTESLYKDNAISERAYSIIINS